MRTVVTVLVFLSTLVLLAPPAWPPTRTPRMCPWR